MAWNETIELSMMEPWCFFAVGMMLKEVILCDGRISRGFASILMVSLDTPSTSHFMTFQCSLFPNLEVTYCVVVLNGLLFLKVDL